MFCQFDDKQRAAVAAIKKVADRLTDSNGWAPIGGDEVELKHAVGLLQDAGMIEPGADLRGSSAPGQYKGPMAFSASPYDDPVQRGLGPNDLPPGAACDMGPPKK
jgi:hypothetical protein